MNERWRCFIAIASQIILDYAIMRVQAKWKGLKLNVAHQLLVYANDVNIVSGIAYIIKKTEPLLVASKEFVSEVNAEKISIWLCLQIRMQDKITT
jgi:hypothetical protein